MTSIHSLLEPVVLLLELAGVAAILIATLIATGLIPMYLIIGIWGSHTPRR